MILLSYATKEDYEKKKYSKKKGTYNELYDVVADRKSYADSLYDWVDG